MQAHRYEIRIQETLDPQWADWFDGLEIRCCADGRTLLSGCIRDQAELHGLLRSSGI